MPNCEHKNLNFMMSGTSTLLSKYLFLYLTFLVYLSGNVAICAENTTATASNTTTVTDAAYAPPCNVTSNCYEKMGFMCHNETCTCKDGLLLNNEECFGGILCVKDNKCDTAKLARCSLGLCKCDYGEVTMRKSGCLGRCNKNTECHINSGFNCSENVCQCMKGLRERNGQCLLGGDCQRTTDCQGISGAICVLNTCTCPYGQKLSHRKSACIPDEEDDGGDVNAGFISTPSSVANLILNAATIMLMGLFI